MCGRASQHALTQTFIKKTHQIYIGGRSYGFFIHLKIFLVPAEFLLKRDGCKNYGQNSNSWFADFA